MFLANTAIYMQIRHLRETISIFFSVIRDCWVAMLKMILDEERGEEADAFSMCPPFLHPFAPSIPLFHSIHLPFLLLLLQTFVFNLSL